MSTAITDFPVCMAARSVLSRDGAGRPGAVPPVVHDNVADPYQYTNLAGNTARPDLDAELRERDARYPWSDLDNEPT